MAGKGAGNRSYHIIYILFCVTFGFLIGWLEGDLAGVRYIGAILGNLGILIFAGSLISYYSPAATTAAINVFSMFIAKLIANYAHATLLSGNISTKYLIIWICTAAVGALLGFIAYHGKDKEWIGAGCAAVPISLILAEAYPVYETKQISLFVDIIFAIILYLMLARGKMQKLMALPFIIVFTVLMIYFDVLTRVFGGM